MVVGVRVPLRSVRSVDAVSLLRTLRRFRRRIAMIGVGFGFALALAGSFEQALANGSPIWSSVFGFPMMHHYLIGFVILAVSLLILEFRRDKA